MSHSQTPLSHPVLHEDERQRCEVWTRVMGYHRPMASFNVGKKGEFAERRYFVEGGVVQAQAVPAREPVCA
ncbi:MAG: anaerobic ribonucleoside-triphosphate reductase [Rubrivivax sp.]|nr:anaerobic ribonucleoside-triphosphate reductase [Rubrivivax sp.]